MSSMVKYWQLRKGSKSERVYTNLEKQIEKIFKHCRQGSIKTRERYKDGVNHFAKFLAGSYNKQNMNNIRNEHLQAYVEQMQEAGYSSSYITTNMSAIRFFIDQEKDSSYIKGNQELGVTPRGSEERIGPSRSWTQNEVHKMQELAIEKGFERVSDMIKLSFLQGIRIHEVTRFEKADLQRALIAGQLTVKGKGGLVRNIPIRNQEAREHLQKLINQTDVRNSKVFVNPGERAHEVMKQAQNFISNNRHLVQEERGDNQANITFHGLRHTYTQERYVELRGQRLNDYDARLQVSKELGHFRVEITNIYLK
ncbi:site-specific integrase [Lachnospiraceae bacterium 50-23]